MTIRYVRDGLRLKRVGVVEGPPPPEHVLTEAEELRDTAALLEAKARSTRQRAQALVAGLLDDHRRRRAAAPHAVANAGALRAPLVTGEQLRRARQLERLGQRLLAEKLDCSRSSIAETERGRRPALPNVAEWVEDVLRARGEWDV